MDVSGTRVTVIDSKGKGNPAILISDPDPEVDITIMQAQHVLHGAREFLASTETTHADVCRVSRQLAGALAEVLAIVEPDS